MRHKILRPDPESPAFTISWDNVPNSLIDLDFAPLLSHINRRIGENFVLIHWQAKLKGLRRWGIYDGSSNNYYSCDVGDIEIDLLEHGLIQINENVIKTLPTAVIYYNNAVVNIEKFPHIIITD